jgi:hypothetical protein
MDKVHYVLARLEEPSTWAANGTGTIAVGLALPPGAASVVVNLLGAFFLALAFFMPEKPKA